MVQRTGQGKNSFNPLRKFWHVLGLVIPLAYYYDFFRFISDLPDFTRLLGSLLLFALTLSLLVVDLARLRFSGFRRWVEGSFGFLMKAEESGRLTAMIPYFFSMFLLVLFFHKIIAVVASIYLIIGDPAAAYIGSRFGRHRLSNGKSLEGVVAFILSGFTSATVFLALQTAFPNRAVADQTFLLIDSGGFNTILISVIALGAVAAAVIECFSRNALFGLLDDNLTVPLAGAIVSAIGFWLLMNVPFEIVFLNPVDIFHHAPF